MKKVFVIILILLGYINSANSQTIIQNSILSGRLTYAGSPYIINQKVIIPKDSILVIEPKVVVKFKSSTNGGNSPYNPGDYDYTALKVGMIEVSGKIIAEGSATDSILFTRSDTIGNWGIILFTENADTNSTLRYCKIEYGHRIFEIYNTSINGVVSFYKSKANIEFCTISNNGCIGISCLESSNPIIQNNYIRSNTADGISCFNSNPLIKNNRIKFDSNGIEIYGSTPLIEDNTISNTQHGIYCSSNASPEIWRNKIFSNLFGIKTWSSSPVIIENQIFDNNVGIDCEAGSKTIKILNNNFYDNGYAIDSNTDIWVQGNTIKNNNQGIQCMNNANIINNEITCNTGNGIRYIWGNSFITGNVVVKNQENGIYVDNCSPKIVNNTIVSNAKSGIRFNYEGEPISNLKPVLINNIIWNNQSSSLSVGKSYFTISAEYNLLQEFQIEMPSEIDLLEGNLFNANPLFADTTIYDFSLLENSLCINKGKSDTTGLFLPEFDITGNPRIISNTVDIGAIESFVLNNSNNINTNKPTIKLFPNPGKEKIYINPIIPDLRYYIFNSEGRIVLTGKLSNSNCIDISDLIAGIYYFKFTWENNIDYEIAIIK